MAEFIIAAVGILGLLGWLLEPVLRPTVFFAASGGLVWLLGVSGLVMQASRMVWRCFRGELDEIPVAGIMIILSAAGIKFMWWYWINIMLSVIAETSKG